MCRMFAYTGSSTSELHALYKALRESALNDTRVEERNTKMGGGS
jgi:hypothetical protein